MADKELRKIRTDFKKIKKLIYQLVPNLDEIELNSEEVDWKYAEDEIASQNDPEYY